MCLTDACVCVSVQRAEGEAVRHHSSLCPPCFCHTLTLLTYAHAFFDRAACAMLRNQLIEVDMRKEKAVSANWDKWSWRWSRDKLACFNVTPIKRDMELQRRNTTHTLWHTMSPSYGSTRTLMCCSNITHSGRSRAQFHSACFTILAANK